MAQSLRGQPPVNQIRTDLPVFPQNFAIQADRNGLIYVGNSSGLLIFDGSHWEIVTVGSESIIRSLEIAEDGTVLVGGFGAFGVLRSSADGSFSFEDFTGLFASQLEGRLLADIWRIVQLDTEVFFIALNDVFAVDLATGATRHWYHEGKFGGATVVDNRLWVQWRGEGLKYLRPGEDEDFVLPEGARDLAEHLMHLHARPPDRLGAVDREGRWWIYDIGNDQAGPLPASDRLLALAGGYASAFPIGDGSLILGTSDGRLIVTDRDGVPQEIIQTGGNWLADIDLTPGGTVLTTDTSAEILSVEWPPRITSLGKNAGLSGEIYRLTRLDDAPVVLSTSGLFVGHETDAGQVHFSALRWGEFTAWDVHGTRTNALVAGQYHLWSVVDGVSTAITDGSFYPRKIVPSAFDPTRLWIAREDGISLVRMTDGRPELIDSWFEAANLALDVVEYAPDQLFVNFLQTGLHRVAYNGPGDFVMDQMPDFKSGSEINLFSLHGLPHVAGNQAIHAFRNDRWQQTDLDGLTALLADDEAIRARTDADGNNWAWSFNRVYYQQAGAQWRRLQSAQLDRGPIESLLLNADGTATFSVANRIITIDPESYDRRVEYPTRLSRVVFVDSAGNESSLPLNERITLQPGDLNSIRFSFAKLDLNQPEMVRYQARLSGLESDWSAWDRPSTYTYTGLVPGQYAFRLRGRDSSGNVSEIEPYGFEVLPRWSDRTAVRLVVLILTISLLSGLILLLAHWRTQSLKRRNVELKSAVDDRTRELARANRRLRVLADIDGLTQIANRRLFDEQIEIHAQQGPWPIALLMIDVDHFKRFNDLHGHLAGDDILIRVATIIAMMAEKLPDRAFAARYGGEEFSVLLRGVDRRNVLKLADTIRTTIQSDPADITVSIGIAMADERTDPEELIKAADRRLYQAKDRGRNQVCDAD